mmetsp:Transcript_3123/g.5248  ORF Transcript_3123/g.5248 Transcript_3123/m.5248 type:complete len:278 (+) Transcript_3123:780-1613(+)
MGGLARQPLVPGALDLLLDQVGHGPHVTGALVPRRDHRVLQVPQVLVLLEYLLEQPEARPGGGHRELRVQGQDDQVRDPVTLDRLDRLLSEGVPVAHGHVALGVHALNLAHRGLEARGLLLGRPPYRGASADGLVPLLGLRRPEVGHDRGQRGLRPGDLVRQPQDVRVREQVVEELLDVLQGLRPPKVEQENAHALVLVVVSHSHRYRKGLQVLLLHEPAHRRRRGQPKLLTVGGVVVNNILESQSALVGLRPRCSQATRRGGGSLEKPPIQAASRP